MYIYIIIGVLEAGDHYVKIPFTTIIADFEISKSCSGLLIYLSITIYSITADKYHVPHIVFLAR